MFASEFVSAACKHFSTRSVDVRRIVATGYSFEEWFNWELIFACARYDVGTAKPRPAYAACGAQGCTFHGDVLVERTMDRLLVEVGVVHDWTGGPKSLAKLENDRAKLLQVFASDVTTIQLVVCASLLDVRTDSRWLNWSQQLSFWSQTPFGDETIELDPGTLRLRSWNWIPPV